MQYETSIHLRLGRALGHVAVMQDAGLYQGRVFLATQYQEGGTLADRVWPWVQPNEHDVRQRIRLFSGYTRGAKEMHDGGYAHCDLKLSNFGIGGDGVGRIIDLDAVLPLADGVSNLLYSRGTPGQTYPPERYAGEHGPESDVWALGVAAYIALCGEAPFQIGRRTYPGDCVHQLSMPLEQSPRYRMGRIVPLSVSQTIMDCLLPRREDRPTVDEMRKIFDYYN